MSESVNSPAGWDEAVAWFRYQVDCAKSIHEAAEEELTQAEDRLVGASTRRLAAEQQLRQVEQVARKSGWKEQASE